MKNVFSVCTHTQIEKKNTEENGSKAFWVDRCHIGMHEHIHAYTNSFGHLVSARYILSLDIHLFRVFIFIFCDPIYGNFHSKINDRACVCWDESTLAFFLHHTHALSTSFRLSYWNAMLWAIIIGHVKFLCEIQQFRSLSLSHSRKHRFEFHFIIIFGMEGKIDWQFIQVLHRKFPSFDTHSNGECLLATKSTSVFISVCVNLPLNKEKREKKLIEREGRCLMPL